VLHFANQEHSVTLAGHFEIVSLTGVFSIHESHYQIAIRLSQHGQGLSSSVALNGAAWVHPIRPMLVTYFIYWGLRLFHLKQIIFFCQLATARTSAKSYWLMAFSSVIALRLGCHLYPYRHAHSKRECKIVGNA
jgi:hypothetical protein